MIDVFITDYSEIAIGPKWKWFIQSRTEGLKKDKRTKAYKAAKKKSRDIETAICILSEFEWSQQGLLEKLP